MEYSKEDLTEARRQIDSPLHKLRETVGTFRAKENAARYKSQITLAERRIKAFEIANALIERELDGETDLTEPKSLIGRSHALTGEKRHRKNSRS